MKATHSDLRKNIKGLERSRKMYEGLWYKELYQNVKNAKRFQLMYDTLYRLTDGEFIVGEDHIKVLSVKKDEIGK